MPHASFHAYIGAACNRLFVSVPSISSGPDVLMSQSVADLCMHAQMLLLHSIAQSAGMYADAAALAACAASRLDTNKLNGRLPRLKTYDFICQAFAYSMKPS